MLATSLCAAVRSAKHVDEVLAKARSLHFGFDGCVGMEVEETCERHVMISLVLFLVKSICTCAL
jgi:hypothetical protein